MRRQLSPNDHSLNPLRRLARATGALAVTGLLLAPLLAHAQYTIVQGQNVERSLNVPCALQYDITGKQPTWEGGGAPNPGTGLAEEHIAWAFLEGDSFEGGNPNPPDHYTAAWRDYKLKVYHASGFAGEHRISTAWNPSLTYTVRFEVNADETTYTVWEKNGAVVGQTTIGATAPARVTMGYGWPPSPRNGAVGAVLTSIVWEEGSAPPEPTGGEPVADTFIWTQNPGGNYGSAANVEIGSNGRVSFLKFEVAGDGSAISSAILTLKATNGGGGGNIHFVPDNSWTEGGLTANNVPCLSTTVLDSLGDVAAGSSYSFDVTAAIPGDGTYSFAIRSDVDNGAAYSSRESAAPPILAITRGTRPGLAAPAACGSTAVDAGVAPQPDAARPDTAQPDTTRPDTAQADATRPDTALAQPDAHTGVDATATADAAAGTDAVSQGDATVSAQDAGALSSGDAGPAGEEVLVGPPGSACGCGATGAAPQTLALGLCAALLVLARRRNMRR